MSIKNGTNGTNGEVYDILHKVVEQEMLHLGLVANVLNAVGGHPQFTNSSFLPTYPSPIPGGVLPGLVMSLEKCSIGLIKEKFAAFETPENILSAARTNVLSFLKNESVEKRRAALKKAFKACKGLIKLAIGNTSPDIIHHNDTIGEFYDRIMCHLVSLNHTLGHDEVFSGTYPP